MTSRTNERAARVKVQAVPVLVLLYMFTSVIVGTPVPPLPASCKTIDGQTDKDHLNCLSSQSSEPEEPSMRRLSSPFDDNNSPPEAKALLFELKKLWHKVLDNPTIATKQAVANKLIKMTSVLTQHSSKKHTQSLTSDFTGPTQDSSEEDEDHPLFRANFILTTSAPTAQPEQEEIPTITPGSNAPPVIQVRSNLNTETPVDVTTTESGHETKLSPRFNINILNTPQEHLNPIERSPDFAKTRQKFIPNNLENEPQDNLENFLPPSQNVPQEHFETLLPTNVNKPHLQNAPQDHLGPIERSPDFTKIRQNNLKRPQHYNPYYNPMEQHFNPYFNPMQQHFNPYFNPAQVGYNPGSTCGFKKFNYPMYGY